MLDAPLMTMGLVRSALRAAVVAALAFAAGCSSGAADNGDGGSDGATACAVPVPSLGPDDATCAMNTPPVPTTTMDAPVQAQAEAAGLAMLDRWLGRYLRGDAPVYRGAASARDTAANLNPPPLFASSPYTDHTLTAPA